MARAGFSDIEYSDEQRRLTTLAAYNILDTEREYAFDKITKIAAHLFNVPVALVTFVDDRRQWFKAAIGTTATEVPKDIAFCAFTVASGRPLIVLDALNDSRFQDNPMVVGAPGIRFNVSVPLRAPDGTTPGTICIVDTVPREEFADHEIELLNDLADVVMAELTLKQALSEKQAALLERDLAQTMLDEALDFSEVAIWRLNVDTGTLAWRGAAEAVWGDEVALSTTLDQAFARIHPEDRERVARDMEAGRTAPIGYRSEFRIILADGRERWLAGRGNYEIGSTGEIMTGVNYDITLRKEQEQYRELLMQEVGHRMGNLFANIHAIISLTRSSATSVVDYVRRVEDRIGALNRAQNMLFASDVANCSLAILLNDIQAVHPQIRWSGDDIDLPETAVVALSLIFNELSTNAVKYGALATEQGSISILSKVSGEIDDARSVELVWKEMGGRPVTAEPTRTGFGTQLIDVSIRDTLEGEITRDWAQDGMTCVLRFSCQLPLTHR